MELSRRCRRRWPWNGKPFLHVLDPTIKKVNAPAAPVAKQAVAALHAEPLKEEKRNLGIILDATVEWYPFVNFLLVDGLTDEDETKFIDGIHKLELSQYVNPMVYKEAERDLIPVIRKFAPEEIMKFLRKNLPFGDFLYPYRETLKDVPAEDTKEQVWEYLLPKYKKMLERFRAHKLSFIHKEARALSSTTIQAVAFAERPVHPQIRIEKAKDEFVLNIEWLLGTSIVPFAEVEQLNAALLVLNFNLYCVASVPELRLVEGFLPSG